MSETTQFFCRQPRSLELISGAAKFDQLSKFENPRNAIYSGDGKTLAFTQTDRVILVDPISGKNIAEILTKDVFDLHFSPLGKYICLWAKPVLLNKESGIWNNNVSIYELLDETERGENLEQNVKLMGVFSNKNQSGWKPQFTLDESLMSKFHNQYEIQFYKLSTQTTEIDFSKDKPFITLKTREFGKISNFSISPGKNPSVAVFIPEDKSKSQPAYIKIYNIPNFNQPVSQKQFFKLEKCHFKWNSLGTSVLALVSTDVDSSNKSYYGETTLYLLGIVGSFDQRITLDKEGPIHDISWSPSSREFGVIYGYMPALTTFFDSRGNSIYSLPPLPRNTILFSPHLKFVLVAGFGNLQGTVDIYDRQNKFEKVATFELSNTSVCSWSPDGRYLLTATTSPRLRVDNCVKIWHASGALLFIKDFQELLGVQWRPQDLAQFPPLKKLEPAPEPHQSAVEYISKKLLKKNELAAASAAKKTVAGGGGGAYRPPHARTGASGSSSSLYQIEMQQSLSGSRPIGAVRTVPGAVPKAVPGAVPLAAESKAAAKNRKKRANKKESKEGSPAVEAESAAAGAESLQAAPAKAEPLIHGGVQSLEDKKIRSLLKKLRAIEQLKEKKLNGEPLEETQVLKIQTEDKVKSELSSLGYKC